MDHPLRPYRDRGGEMKTLRELGIEPSNETISSMPIMNTVDPNFQRKTALELSPEQAARVHISVRFGSVLYHQIEMILAHYGGKIVFEGDDQE